MYNANSKHKRVRKTILISDTIDVKRKFTRDKVRHFIIIKWSSCHIHIASINVL